MHTHDVSIEEYRTQKYQSNKKSNRSCITRHPNKEFSKRLIEICIEVEEQLRIIDACPLYIGDPILVWENQCNEK